MSGKGSKLQVWNGTAKHTAGGLERSDLMINKRGKVVSKKKHEQGKKSIKNLAPYVKTVRGGMKYKLPKIGFEPNISFGNGRQKPPSIVALKTQKIDSRPWPVNSLRDVRMY